MAYKGGIDKYTKLLISPNAADGATTFTDVIGTHALTANGNAQHDTAQKKFRGSSMLFDGSGDYISFGSHSDFAFGTGDFTIDMWVRFNSSPSGERGLLGLNSTSNGIDLFINDTTTIRVWLVGSANNFTVPTMSTGAWYHVALIRRSGTVRVFLNGTESSSGGWSNSGSVANGSTNKIGARVDGSSVHDGWIDELRVSKGIARWADDFTTPDQPYEVYDHALAATDKLLLNFSGNNGDTSADDESASNHTPTFNGNAKIAARKWRTHVPIFDGTGDYISAADHADWRLGGGSGNFTMEGWFRWRSTGSNRGLATQRVSADDQWALWYDNTNSRLTFWQFVSSSKNIEVLGSWTPTAHTWYHIAVVRGWNGNANDYAITVDGVVVGTATDADSVSDFAASLQVGAGAGVSEFHGWITGFRISNTARYTAAFTPSATEFVSDGNTKLLILGSNDIADINSTTITDEGATGHTLTANGNAKLAGPTAVGSGSLQSDGSGDHISIADNADWDIGTGDMTVEGWVMWNGTSTPGSTTLLELASASEFRIAIYDTGGVAGFHIYYDGTEHYSSHAYTPVPNRWYHFCGVRYGNKLYFWIDGVQNGDIENVTGADIQGSSGLRIGGTLAGAAAMNGYVDGVRMTKGLARFTEAFEVPGGYGEDDPNAGGVQGKLELIGGRV